MYFTYILARLAELERTIAEGGGFTVEPSTLEPVTTGYMVGLGGAIPWAQKEVTGRVLIHKADSVKAMADFQKRDWKFGGWVSDGLAYLEAAERFETLEGAMAAAVERGEKAIFHLDTMTEVPVQ